LVIGEKVIGNWELGRGGKMIGNWGKGQPELIINPSIHVMLSPVINTFSLVSER